MKPYPKFTRICSIGLYTCLLIGLFAAPLGVISRALDKMPQGELAYVTCSRQNQYQGGDLQRFDLTDGTSHPLTNDGAEYAQPTWSPDGTRLMFRVKIKGENRIQVMDAEGDNRHTLAIGTAPAWSPDGRMIAYAAPLPIQGEQAPRYALYVMDADGQNQTRISGPEFVNVSDPTWSPDGKVILFAARSAEEGGVDLYQIAPDGAAPERLTHSPDVSESHPAFSPDGQWIAFSANDGISIDLYLMPPDGSEISLLAGAENGARYLDPVWSPDGAHLAFRTQFAFEDSDQGPEGIYLIKPEGDQRALIIPNGCDPAWRPSHK